MHRRMKEPVFLLNLHWLNLPLTKCFFMANEQKYSISLCCFLGSGTINSTNQFPFFVDGALWAFRAASFVLNCQKLVITYKKIWRCDSGEVLNIYSTVILFFSTVFPKCMEEKQTWNITPPPPCLTVGHEVLFNISLFHTGVKKSIEFCLRYLPGMDDCGQQNIQPTRWSTVCPSIIP